MFSLRKKNIYSKSKTPQCAFSSLRLAKTFCFLFWRSEMACNLSKLKLFNQIRFFMRIEEKKNCEQKMQ